MPSTIEVTLFTQNYKIDDVLKPGKIIDELIDKVIHKDPESYE
jgi:hypothetical protein